MCKWNVDWHIVFVFNCVCRLRLQIVFSILMAIWIAFIYSCDIDCVCHLRVSFALIDGVYLLLNPLRFLCVCFSFSIAFVDCDYRLRFRFYDGDMDCVYVLRYRLCLSFACIVCINRWPLSNAISIAFFVCVGGMLIGISFSFSIAFVDCDYRLCFRF